MILEFGTLKLDKNCSELKFPDLNATVSFSPLMENLFSLDGMMVRLDLSFLNQESFSSQSMMHTIMELLLLLELTIAKKIVSGGMEGEVRVWRIGRQT